MARLGATGVVIDAGMLERYAALDTATVHEAQGRSGQMDPGIRRVWPAPPVVGRALTARCHPGDNLAIHRAVAVAERGDVLVVDAHGDLGGYWGALLTEAGLARGVKALVIDGGCRDVAATETLAFGVWARGVHVRGCVKATPGTVGEPIVCGGVAVATGDLVIADADGVVVVPSARAGEVLQAAEARAAREQETTRALREGQSTLDLLGLRDVLARHGLDDSDDRRR